ncbi:MAG: 2,3-bisphosphoglycerate-independent phosphoglycerate mutase, partial [Tenericutes bacterium]
MSPSHKPLTLIILDGWGYSEDPRYNAILTAKTPVWDQLWNNKPHTLISASGAGVGLPGDQMGNSEVGHLNLGAGRVVYQEFTRISRAIRTGSFFTNRTLVHLTEAVVENNKALHIMGLLSSGGVHSHESHIHAMVELAVKQGVKKIYVHAFLDGRDTPPKSALSSIEAMESKFKELGGGQFGSLIGRYYALDRDRRWTRVAKAYNLITEGKATFEAADAISALDMAYARGETDEFVQATAIIAKDQKPITIEDGDGMIFMNFRSDRARALTEAFINPQFDSFEKSRNINLVEFVSLTEYKKDFNLPTAFPAELLKNTLGGYLATLGLRQLRIAETEKYAHVTFFLNGG